MTKEQEKDLYNLFYNTIFDFLTNSTTEEIRKIHWFTSESLIKI